jgi:hypothetical protein
MNVEDALSMGQKHLSIKLDSEHLPCFSDFKFVSNAQRDVILRRKSDFSS